MQGKTENIRHYFKIFTLLIVIVFHSVTAVLLKIFSSGGTQPSSITEHSSLWGAWQAPPGIKLIVVWVIQSKSALHNIGGMEVMECFLELHIRANSYQKS